MRRDMNKKERGSVVIDRLFGWPQSVTGSVECGRGGWMVHGFSAQRSLEEAQVDHGDTCWEIWAEFAPRFVHNVRDGCSHRLWAVK